MRSQSDDQMDEARVHLTLLTMQKQLMDEHSATYYQWIRNLITLASGVLTALISFRNAYIPQNPTAIWLLQCCWSFLFGSVVLGQLALYGQTQAPFEAANRIGDALNRSKKEKEDAYAVATFQGVTVTPNIIYHYASQVAVVVFALALFLLVLFASINMTTPNPTK